MSKKESDLQIGIIMGSVNDLYVMRCPGLALTELGFNQGVDYEERNVSAHRSPDWETEYAEAAEDRGLKIIIAGAGGSAALPGNVASKTILPVLSVAVTKNPDVMNQALGSTIGIPEGKPLAVFQGEKGAFNAGLFAARILALNDPELRQVIRDYDSNMEAGVLDKDKKLQELGAEEYIKRYMLEED